MLNKSLIVCVAAISVLLVGLSLTVCAFTVNYDQDMFAEEVDGHIWQKMSPQERKAFWLGVYHMADTSSEERISISTASKMAQQVTAAYKNTGDWDKTVLEIAREASNMSGEQGNNARENSEEPKKQDLDISYEGNGNKITEPFTVKSECEVKWETSGRIFQLFLQTPDGEKVDTLVQTLGEGEGSSTISTPGTYRLKIDATGSWEIDIQEEGS